MCNRNPPNPLDDNNKPSILLIIFHRQRDFIRPPSSKPQFTSFFSLFFFCVSLSSSFSLLLHTVMSKPVSNLCLSVYSDTCPKSSEAQMGPWSYLGNRTTRHHSFVSVCQQASLSLLAKSYRLLQFAIPCLVSPKVSVNKKII